MRSDNKQITFRRILVALDASSDSLAGLQAAATLAAQFEAELIGLFVEDLNLLNLASLPFASEVGYPSANKRRIDSLTMERALKAQAFRAREALLSVAQRKQVSGSFRTVRGHIIPELLTAAGEVDLLVAGQTGWDIRRRALGGTARALMTEVSRLLLVCRETTIGLPVRVVYTGPSANQALRIAARVVLAQGDLLTVLLQAESPKSIKMLERQVVEQLSNTGLILDIYDCISNQILLKTLQAGHDGIVVIESSHPLAGEGNFSTFFKFIKYPVLLVH